MLKINNLKKIKFKDYFYNNLKSKKLFYFENCRNYKNYKSYSLKVIKLYLGFIKYNNTIILEIGRLKNENRK